MTLSPNANWLAKNDAATKQPIYAVNFPDQDADVWYHDHEITGATVDHYKYLVSISPRSHTFNRLRSELSIGGFTFELLNSSAIWNFTELYKTSVVVKAGYKGLDWSDYIVITPTSYVQNIKSLNNNSWQFTCQDISQQMDKDIFTSITTATGTADSGSLTTLVDSARTEADDFWNGGKIRLTGGTGSGQESDITDFDAGTDTITFDAMAIAPDDTSTYKVVESDGVISLRNIVTIWLQIMTTKTGDTSNGAYDVLDSSQGLGIDQSLVDITECELIRDDFLTWQTAEYVFTDEFNAKDFFQEDVYRAFALTPVLKKNGKISLRAMLPPLFGYTQANGLGTTMTDSEVLDIPEWQAEYRDIVNFIRFKHNWDWVTEAYITTTQAVDTASQSQNGTSEITLATKSIAGTFSNVDGINRVANRYFQRFATLPSVIKVKVKFSERVIEAGDTLQVTSAEIPNADTSTYVWSGRGAEVDHIAPDFDAGVINITLRDIGLGELKYGVISPGGTVDYGSASAAQKQTYCWIDQGYVII